MTWFKSTSVEDRFFILVDWGEEIQVDIVDGQLIPEKRLTKQQEKYFKIDFDDTKKFDSKLNSL